VLLVKQQIKKINKLKYLYYLLLQNVSNAVGHLRGKNCLKAHKGLYIMSL